MTNYDYVEFKSGLVIEYDSNLTQEYVTSLGGIDSEKTFNSHKNKWRPIIQIESSYDDFLKYKDNPDGLLTCEEKHINLFLPILLLKSSLLASRFGVPSGTIIIQLLNSGVLTIKDDIIKDEA